MVKISLLVKILLVSTMPIAGKLFLYNNIKLKLY